MERLLKVINNKEIINYIFWGILTVLFGVLSFYLLLTLNINYKIANVISIISTKIFAYLTNKFFVYKVKSKNLRECVMEMIRFILARGFSGIVEFIGLIIIVKYLEIDEIYGKILMIIITTILNYNSGKKVVFIK